MTDDNSSTLFFQHTQTQFYRLIYSDGVAVSSYVDPGSFRYQLTFYHFDFNPITETQKVAPHDSGKGFKGLETKIDHTLKKIDEISVMVTPDKLYEIASVLIGNLNLLSPEQREKYNIPAQFVLTANGLGEKID